MAVHRELGPGLLESTYEVCLAYELAKRGLANRAAKRTAREIQRCQVRLWYRIDLLLEDKVIVELKAVERLESIHIAQVLSKIIRL